MSRFLDRASEIFEAARAGEGSSEVTILIHPAGQIHIVEGGDSAMEALRSQHNARTAYRVIRENNRVRVEGRENGNRCVIERDRPHRAPDFLVDRPLYSVATTPLLA